jgi:hypothetical protein
MANRGLTVFIPRRLSVALAGRRPARKEAIMPGTDPRDKDTESPAADAKAPEVIAHSIYEEQVPAGCPLYFEN